MAAACLVNRLGRERFLGFIRCPFLGAVPSEKRMLSLLIYAPIPPVLYHCPFPNQNRTVRLLTAWLQPVPSAKVMHCFERGLYLRFCTLGPITFNLEVNLNERESRSRLWDGKHGGQ